MQAQAPGSGKFRDSTPCSVWFYRDQLLDLDKFMSHFSVAVMKLPDVDDFVEESSASAHSFRDSVSHDRFHLSLRHWAQGVPERSNPYGRTVGSREVGFPWICTFLPGHQHL